MGGGHTVKGTQTQQGKRGKRTNGVQSATKDIVSMVWFC